MEQHKTVVKLMSLGSCGSILLRLSVAGVFSSSLCKSTLRLSVVALSPLVFILRVLELLILWDFDNSTSASAIDVGSSEIYRSWGS